MKITPRIQLSKTTLIIGSRQAMSGSDTKRRCISCSFNVFLSRPYPHDIAVTCEICAPNFVHPNDNVGVTRQDFEMLKKWTAKMATTPASWLKGHLVKPKRKKGGNSFTR